jgi:transposase InsO family protein
MLLYFVSFSNACRDLNSSDWRRSSMDRAEAMPFPAGASFWHWRSVKYEEVYLHAYANPAEARQGLDRYFRFYNQRRTHQGLDRRTPDEVYFQTNGLRKAA